MMNNPKAKKRKLDGSLTSFWLKQIEDGAPDAGLDGDATEELKASIRDALTSALSDEQYEAFKAIADTDEAVLMADIATEKKRLKRLKKKFDEAKEDLHADQRRLENYTRAREKQEETEANDVRDRLNADAKAVIDDDQKHLRSMSPKARVRLKLAQAVAERQCATAKAHHSHANFDLQALLTKLGRLQGSSKSSVPMKHAPDI